MTQKNPINQDEKERQVQEPKRVEPELESNKFSPAEQKKIVEMILDDIKTGEEAMAEWKQQKTRDLQHLNSEKPSIIEGLTKEAWMSDRNLGLAAGIHDIYQATLLATCWNPDTIHFKASETNDVDNRDSGEKFMKWVVSEAESNVTPEVDDHINHRVGLGFGLFKIYWEVKYEWVDKRIPIPSKDNKKRIIGYKIETEHRRREKGRMVNVDNLDNILIPSYGKNVQELPFFIEIIEGFTNDDLEDLADRKIIVNFQDGKFIGIDHDKTGKLRSVEERALGTSSTTTQTNEGEKRNRPVPIYEWYGWYKKEGKREKYRFWIEPQTKAFLSGKPLRKINRAGKVPFVGGPLRRRPGFLRGGSLMGLISHCINALNNVFNQVSDFQYQENCPDGWYDKNDEFLKGSDPVRVPGKLRPVDGDPNKKIFIPNNQRSMAWAYQYIEFLLQMVERLTGAASYFLTSDQKNATATRDNIVEEKGQVKFGLWVKRIQQDITEGLNMLFSMYQDWAPPDLAKRVLNEEGKSIIKNLSIDSLKGNYDIIMTPDITSGSKAYERQVAMFGVQAANEGCIWLSPQFNPRGNWLMWKEAFKKQGFQNPEHFMPPQPKDSMDYSKEAEAHFNQLKQGDKPEPPGPENPQVVECFATFIRLKETKYQELDKEYRANFDAYFFEVAHNYRKFMQQVQMDQMANRIASQATSSLENMGVTRRPQGQAPVAPAPSRNGNQAVVVGGGAPGAGFPPGE